MLLCALSVLALLFSASVSAQPGSSEAGLKVGVIASRTGAQSGNGEAQWLLATAWEADLQLNGGVFGAPLALTLLDDGSSPETARRHAEDLVADGALAIVCCTTPVASRSVAQVAEEAGVLLLSPTELPSASTDQNWSFSLYPDDTDVIAAVVADAYRENRHSLALMALDGHLGDKGEADLSDHLQLLGREVRHVERYPAGVSELRPEALMVAASQPGGVVIWGLADDLMVATDALKRRGYEGKIYARTALLAPGAARLPWSRVLGVRFAVPPAAVVPPAARATGFPPSTREHSAPQTGRGGTAGACAAAGADQAAVLADTAWSRANPLATSPLLSALELLTLGLEQFVALQVPSSDPLVLRQALRDSLVGLPATCTGAGLIKFREGSTNTVEPNGLAIATVGPGGLTLGD